MEWNTKRTGMAAWQSSGSLATLALPPTRKCVAFLHFVSAVKAQTGVAFVFLCVLWGWARLISQAGRRGGAAEPLPAGKVSIMLIWKIKAEAADSNSMKRMKKFSWLKDSYVRRPRFVIEGEEWMPRRGRTQMRTVNQITKPLQEAIEKKRGNIVKPSPYISLQSNRV